MVSQSMPILGIVDMHLVLCSSPVLRYERDNREERDKRERAREKMRINIGKE